MIRQGCQAGLQCVVILEHRNPSLSGTSNSRIFQGLIETGIGPGSIRDQIQTPDSVSRAQLNLRFLRTRLISPYHSESHAANSVYRPANSTITCPSRSPLGGWDSRSISEKLAYGSGSNEVSLARPARHADALLNSARAKVLQMSEARYPH
jgi:hypothetical protein